MGRSLKKKTQSLAPSYIAPPQLKYKIRRLWHISRLKTGLTREDFVPVAFVSGSSWYVIFDPDTSGCLAKILIIVLFLIIILLRNMNLMERDVRGNIPWIWKNIPIHHYSRILPLIHTNITINFGKWMFVAPIDGRNSEHIWAKFVQKEKH